MAIYRLLQDAAFDPEAVTAMTAAYEEAFRKLGLSDRGHPVAELIAAKIIACASMGELDSSRLCEAAVQGHSQIGLSEPSGAWSQAQQFRQHAAQCVDLAERMSLSDDKARLLQMAQQWLEIAKDFERHGNAPPA